MSASLLVLIALPSFAGSLDALPSVVGPGDNQAFTSAVPAGDMDGDGLGDLVLGSPWDDTSGFHEAGGVWIVYEVADLGQYSLVADHAVFLAGEQPVDHAGYSVASIGDTDEDGYPEVAVGAPEATSDAANVSGKVYILYSDSDRLEAGSLGDYPYMTGAEKFARLGSRVFAVGNVDGDAGGKNDLMLGVPFATPNGDVATGWVGIVLAGQTEWGPGNPRALRMAFDLGATPPEWNIEGAQVGYVKDGGETLFGRAAARIPDVDGDGVDDLVIGGPHVLSDDAVKEDPDNPDSVITGPGVAYIFSVGTVAEQQLHPTQLADTEAIGTISGSVNGDHVPWLLDTTADGRVVVSVAERDLGTGGVYLLEGQTGDQTLDGQPGYVGEETVDLTGWGVARADGVHDEAILAIGSPGWDLARGKISFVVDTTEEGPLSESEVAVLEGCWIDGQAGASVLWHPGPDPHGQDRPWMAAVAPWASVNGFSDGLAVVITAETLPPALDASCEAIFPSHPVTDGDGDGLGITDCDDADATVYPGAPEACGNGVDEDCDGVDKDCYGYDTGEAARCGCAVGSPASGAGVFGLAALVLMIRRRQRAVVAAGALGVSASAQAQEWDAWREPQATLWGATGFEYLHGPVVSGDFDGDGAADLLIGSYSGHTDFYAAGRAYLLDHAAARGNVWLDDADVTILGNAEHDWLGSAVLTVPDPDGGPDAALIGANHLGLTENDQGEGFLFRAPLAGGLPPIVPAADPDVGLTDVTLKGSEPGDAFGSAFAYGDIDGDGTMDLAASAPFEDSAERDEAGFPDVPEQGRVWLFHNDRIHDEISAPQFADMYSTASIIGEAPGKSALGWRLAMGDLDGDGHDELVVGTIGTQGVPFGGELQIYSDIVADPIGRPEPHPMSEARATLYCEVRDAACGMGLQAVDLDDDGDDDLVVSSPYLDFAAGRVWLIDGLEDGVTTMDDAAYASWSGPEGSGAGYAVAAGPAVLVGAPDDSAVHVLDLDLQPLGVFVGRAGEMLGHSVSWVGDLDEDDVEDAVMVAPAVSDRRTMQGVAIVQSGQRTIDGDFPPLADVDDLVFPDADLDGTPAWEDCDDYDPGRSLDRAEQCGNGVDDNCNGFVDEAACEEPKGCASAGRGAGFASALLAAALVTRRRARRS